MSEILAEKDSRVRETASRMRLKKFFGPDFSGSSLPKRVVIIVFSLIGTAESAELAGLAELASWRALRAHGGLASQQVSESWGPNPPAKTKTRRVRPNPLLRPCGG